MSRHQSAAAILVGIGVLVILVLCGYAINIVSYV